MILTTLILAATISAIPQLTNVDLTSQVEEYYASVMKGRVVSYELEIRRLPQLKDGMEVVIIHGEENRTEPPRGSRICWIKVKQNGRFRDLPATIAVKPVEDVPVALADITPRTPLTPDLYEIQRVETQTFGARHVPTPEELTDYWAKVRIPGGSVISEPRIAPIPVVVVGQQLKIVFRIGQIEAIAEGKALEDGRLGERIRVQNLVSGFKLKARVEKSDLVSVE